MSNPSEATDMAADSILDIKTLTPHIGAEIRGIDLSQPLGNDEFSAIYQAWLETAEPKAQRSVKSAVRTLERVQT